MFERAKASEENSRLIFSANNARSERYESVVISTDHFSGLVEQLVRCVCVCVVCVCVCVFVPTPTTFE